MFHLKFLPKNQKHCQFGEIHNLSKTLHKPSLIDKAKFISVMWCFCLPLLSRKQAYILFLFLFFPTQRECSHRWWCSSTHLFEKSLNNISPTYLFCWIKKYALKVVCYFLDSSEQDKNSQQPKKLKAVRRFWGDHETWGQDLCEEKPQVFFSRGC